MMWWPYGPWEWFPLMLIIPLIFLGVMLFFLTRMDRWPMFGGSGRREGEESAREILDRRFARGEISREEYQQMRKTLE